MMRVHYRPPEQMPPHERDFPRSAVPQDDGSSELLLLIVTCLIVVFLAIAVLGLSTPAPKTDRHTTNAALQQFVPAPGSPSIVR
jgi:hypothetical protein